MKWELRDNESVTKLLYMLRVIHDILLKGALQVRDVILIRLEVYLSVQTSTSILNKKQIMTNMLYI